MQYYVYKYIKSAMRVEFEQGGYNYVHFTKEFLMSQTQPNRTFYLFARTLDMMTREELKNDCLENLNANLELTLDDFEISIDEYLEKFNYKLIDKYLKVFANNLNTFYKDYIYYHVKFEEKIVGSGHSKRGAIEDFYKSRWELSYKYTDHLITLDECTIVKKLEL